jgi:hypothetical protein
MKTFFKILLLLIGTSTLLMLSNCKKTQLLTDNSAKLEFSADTVLFDTVFTTIGSTTKYFKIYNNNSGKLIVSDIWLAGGTQSQFRINVDGDAGVSFSELEIEANDSLFIFVEVTVDPNNSNNPLVVEDSIMFLTNGSAQRVLLNAWGQDAYFHVKEVITADETWNNDKPHVIYNYCAVDSAITLTIPAGTKVHGHNSATLLVYKGSLLVNGSVGNPVEFSQDRTADYLLYPADSVAGQWRGIYFIEPLTSSIDFAEIKNAVIGIQIDTVGNGTTVNLNSVKIDNSLFAGILTQGANVTAVNCLFGNSAQYSAVISIGGSVNFDHCTFGNYWNGTRNSGLFVFSDYYESGSTIQHRPFTTANFTNSIIYGNNDNEFVLDTLPRNSAWSITGSAPVFNFANCLIKTDTTIADANFFSSCITNSDPLFVNPSGWDYHVPSNSPAVGQAFGSTSGNDLDGNGRFGNTIGCYEYQ